MRKRYGLLVFLLLILVAASVQAGYYDFGGATITIMGGSGRFEESGGSAPASGTAYGLHKEAEELFNCKIVFYGDVGWNDLVPLYMARLLSGDAEYDIWPIDSHRFWALVGQGVLFPVDTILPDSYFENLPGVPRGGSELMSFYGHRYGFGTVGGTMSGILGITYLPQLFDELGLPDPQQLYLEGAWTWEAMADIARLATADTTGDGQTDRFGITGLGRSAYLYPFLYSNNGAALVSVIDGRMTFTGTDSLFVDSVNMVTDWMQEGIANPRNIQAVGPELESGRAAMVLGPIHTGLGVPDLDYRIVPLPMGPAATEHAHSSIFIHGQFLLPVNSRHPEGMVQLVDFLWPPEDYMLATEDYIRSLAKDRTTASILWEMHDNWSGYVQRLTQPGDGLFPAIQALEQAVRDQRPIASSMAEVAPAIQATLDEFFNN